jgi:hypothetical protein
VKRTISERNILKKHWKMSAASKGNQNMLGKTHSEETKAKMSAARKGKQQSKIQCPYCQKIGGCVI